MRFSSIDLGSRRRDGTADRRDLEAALREWQEESPQPPEKTGHLRSSSLSRSHSLSSKLSRAFSLTRKGSPLPPREFEISAPISTTVRGRGLAVAEFGTPVRTSEGWEDFVPVVIDRSLLGKDDSEFIPGGRDASRTPLHAAYTSSPAGRSTLGSPFVLTASSPGSRSSPSKTARTHGRHQSEQLPARYYSPPTSPSAEDTPIRMRPSAKRHALYYHNPPHLSLPFETSFVCPESPVSPTPSGKESPELSQFRIRRKPVPRMEIEMPPTPITPTMGETSLSMAKSPQPQERPQRPPAAVSTGTSSAVVQALGAAKADASNPNRRSLVEDMDELFDELLDQCSSLSSQQRSVTRPSHQRSRSLQTQPGHYDPSSEDYGSLRRSHAMRKSLSNGSRPLPSFSRPPPLPPKDDRPEKRITGDKGEEDDEDGLRTPRARSRHHHVSDLRPFFPLGGTFEPIRKAPQPPPRPLVPTTPARATLSPVVETPPDGRVKTAVWQIERNHPSPSAGSTASTPVSKLEAILNQQIRVDSSELTLESKRMMEEARRRRAKAQQA